MKVILLAGGFGTRLSEYTGNIPRPMVKIGEKPILWHIMKYYAHFGHKDFYVALGYKAEIIKEYFLHYKVINTDFTVALETGVVTSHQQNNIDWKVTLVDTGIHSMTGGRVKRIKPYINNETFLLTYGDGVTDVDLDQLIKFHKNHGKMVTITAVPPMARFGELKLDGSSVTSFDEKPQLGQGWISGGYFVIEPEFFDLISDDSIMLEREPLEKVAKEGELKAFKHFGFWKCMDNKRDHDMLVKIWESGQVPWDMNST